MSKQQPHVQLIEEFDRTVSPQSIADHVHLILDRISYGENNITVIQQTSRPGWPHRAAGDRPFTIHFHAGQPFGTTLKSFYMEIVPAASLIKTEGAFGSGWQPLLFNIAHEYVRYQCDLIKERFPTISWPSAKVMDTHHFRWTEQGLALLNQDKLRQVRAQLAGEIASRSYPELVERISMFEDCIETPLETEDALRHIAQWGFNPCGLPSDKAKLLMKYIRNHLDSKQQMQRMTPGLSMA
ncbi:MAG: hypothetical protein OXC95_13785 [Dehalococcoidia bacterium]|nr:hypothetical protein [Dehalococcoidia bacterium]